MDQSAENSPSLSNPAFFFCKELEGKERVGCEMTPEKHPASPPGSSCLLLNNFGAVCKQSSAFINTASRSWSGKKLRPSREGEMYCFRQLKYFYLLSGLRVWVWTSFAWEMWERGEVALQRASTWSKAG